jgi:hypothetical protein
MPILKTETKGNIKVYTVEKEFSDVVLDQKMSKKINRNQIKLIIDYNADVFTADGRLLLRFRKNALPKTHIDIFYDSVIKFAHNTTANRGTASGSKTMNISTNPRVMSNIFGYFDRWTPYQKYMFKKKGKYPSVDIRECKFNMDFPELYKKTIPLVEDIDQLYKKLTPENYQKQKKKANETFFKIGNSSFTTVTTNVNYQTTIHTDKGDDEEGFGNLAVIERGHYTGGETCFPQYGIGVDVRTGDILFMDVHQPHANLPIILKDKESKRLSIVCYLRKNVWIRTKGKSKAFYEAHNKSVRALRFMDPKKNKEIAEKKELNKTKKIEKNKKTEKQKKKSKTQKNKKGWLF